MGKSEKIGEIHGLPITLQKFEKCDFKEVWHVINSIAEEDSGYRKLNFKEMKMLFKQRERLIRKRCGIFFIIKAANKIIGECTIHKEKCTSHLGFLGIGILKEFRNLGIGQKAISKTMDIARRKIKNLKVLQVNVSEKNKRAIHVYEKLGFREAKHLPKTAELILQRSF